MQNNIDRAVQFKAFDALKGFREALEEVERTREKENIFESLDIKLKKLNKGDRIIIEYYNDLDYLEIRGTVKKIENNKVYLNNTKINFEDIVSLKKY